MPACQPQPASTRQEHCRLDRVQEAQTNFIHSLRMQMMNWLNKNAKHDKAKQRSFRGHP